MCLMLNDDQDDDTPVDTDPELGEDFAEIDAEGDEPEAPAPPRRAAAKKKPAARTKTAKAAPKASTLKAASPKAAAKPPKKSASSKKAAKKAAKAAKKQARKAPAKSATPPGDLTAVKAGAHTLWVSKDLAAALTSKDQRKLKALLKRAEKRRKSKKA